MVRVVIAEDGGESGGGDGRGTRKKSERGRLATENRFATNDFMQDLAFAAVHLASFPAESRESSPLCDE